MYTTVNALMGLWNVVIARRARAIPIALADIRTLVDSITLETCFDRTTWKQMTTFVLVVPDGDVLPSRAAYYYCVRFIRKFEGVCGTRG